LQAKSALFKKNKALFAFINAAAWLQPGGNYNPASSQTN
jgi:hypothetical protein